MENSHSLAQSLIKVTGLTLNEPEKFQVQHINVSKSENFNNYPDKLKGDEEQNESVVIKVVLEKITRKV